MKILNLGAGNRIIEGADNHDIVKHRPEINLVFDLDKVIKYQFANWKREIILQKETTLSGFELYDRIELISVIEHLDSVLQALNECWYLLKSTGVLVVKYPHVSSWTAFRDPTHKHFMDEYSLDYVDPNTKHGKECDYYTPYKWTILTLPENRLIKRGDRINVKLEMRPIK